MHRSFLGKNILPHKIVDENIKTTCLQKKSCNSDTMWSLHLIKRRPLIIALELKDTCDWVGVNQDEREQQVMAAVLLKSLCQESSAQLNMWKPLMQTKGTGESIR